MRDLLAFDPIPQGVCYGKFNKKRANGLFLEKERVCLFYFKCSRIFNSAQYPASEGIISSINTKVAFFFKESITRFAVPMYFILSGMLFFRDYSNKKYVTKLKSRFFTLCIPYIIWNTVWMLFEIICSYTFISSFFTGRKLFSLNPWSVFRAVFLAECNIPFWFVSYLIVFVFLSPIFNLIVKNKYVGIATVSFLSVFHALEIGSFKYDAIAFYLIGAILGKHYFEFFIKKNSKKSSVFSIAFLCIYIIAKNIFPSNEYFAKPILKIAIFSLAAYALWSAVDLFMDKISSRPLYTRSFAIFAMHTNVSAVVCEIIFLVLPNNPHFAFPNFVLTLILTLLLINIFCIIGERLLPRTYALLMGKGIKT